MEEFEDIIPKIKWYTIAFLFLFLVLLLVFGYFYFTNKINTLNNENSNDIYSEDILKVENNKEEQAEMLEKLENSEIIEYIVDVKGEVKNPGVYILDRDSRVIDAVKKAGGFTKNADTTFNNLSKKVSDEMVIIIYSKKEISDFTTVKKKEELVLAKCNDVLIKNDSCIEKTNKNEKNGNDADKQKEVKNDIININTASKNELMKLQGIGESKANAIIEYRSKNKFISISDIRKVSGIGDSLFEKIKDNITV